MASSLPNPRKNYQWRLVNRPQGRAQESDFEWRDEPITDLGEGDILVRNIFLSLDPTNRVWMDPITTYLPMLELGSVMRGMTLGVVEASQNPQYAAGDIVHGLGGWQKYYVGTPVGWSKLPLVPGVPSTAWFGAMAHIGFTAYFGLFDIGRPMPGETLVVDAAAGAVGSLVGQMGKIAGCRVVGIAGTDDKCEWITRELGFDAAINYKKQIIRVALRRACPNGIDIDFENVGGDILDAILGQINLHGRVVLCGMISQYNTGAAPKPPVSFGNILMKRARVEGFIVTDYASRFPEAAEKIIGWLKEGRLKYRIDMVEGLRAAPAALNRLFDGTNTGKLMVKVSDVPA